MSELIKREDAIKATWHEPSCIHPYNVLAEVRDRINALPTASPWHRVEEPPKKDGKYLVCWKDGGGFCYDTAWWTSVGTWSLSHWTGVTVTHWMPVEPPKEVTNE